jgi:hypothetical protein
MARRRKHRPAAAPRPADGRIENRVEIAPAWLEVARAHDGVLRGHPEPVFLAAAWIRDPGGTAFVARRTWRPPKISGPVPLRVEVDRGDTGFDHVIRHQEDARLVLLVIALEEDSGKGAAEIYAALQSADALRLWSPEARIPDPLTVGEIAVALPKTAQFAPAVHVVHGERDLRDDCRGDEWIGAALSVTPLARGGPHAHLRYHFVSSDAANDWTLGVKITAPE